MQYVTSNIETLFQVDAYREYAGDLSRIDKHDIIEFFDEMGDEEQIIGEEA